MARVHIWIRKEDEAAWAAIKNKPEWLHEHLRNKSSKTDITNRKGIEYLKPYGKYRDFDEKEDMFPQLPDGIIPVYILEEENWTFVWGIDANRNYVFEWDKVSTTYNSYRFEDRA